MININLTWKSLHDKYKLFTHFYLAWLYLYYISTKKEAWFVSLVSRGYHGVEPTTFKTANWQKSYPMVNWTAKQAFSQV